MPGNGKIARLPRHVREQVNLKLDDNLKGNEILAWLNELPETKAMLLKHFAGAPVSKQNLSEWRLGGFKEWRTQKELQDYAEEIMQSNAEMADETRISLVANDLALNVAGRYAKLLTWDGQGEEGTMKQLKALRILCRDVAVMQRTLEQGNRHQTELFRQEQEEEKQEWQARKDKVLAPIHAKIREEELTMEYASKGLRGASELAKMVTKVEFLEQFTTDHDEEVDEESRQMEEALQVPVRPTQTKSKCKSRKKREPSRQQMEIPEESPKREEASPDSEPGPPPPGS